MNFEELQMKRESCRVYADRPVTREQLVHLVDVARFAPSACNSQPWHFILVDEPETVSYTHLTLPTTERV